MVRSWNELRRLRSHFLSEDPSLRVQDYWGSIEQLEDYDQTFAQRIAWKWQAVLERERSTLEMQIGSLGLLDWGCGSGIALRTFIEKIPGARGRPLFIHDRSKLAVDFTERKLNALGLSATPQLPKTPFLLLLSHVLNELRPEDDRLLLDLLQKAHAVCWVEPGTSSVSKRLIDWRERLRRESKMVALGPCPHAGTCGLLSPENARHWCHFFARVPPGIAQDPFWGKFRVEMEIDLRSLPVSYLVMGAPPRGPMSSRIVGEPRLYKGYAQMLVCNESGVGEQKVLKRESTTLWKKLRNFPFASSLEDLRGDGK